MCQNKSAKIYSKKKIITVCNAVYFRLCINLMHFLPPVTADGWDGSHHPRYAEWASILSLPQCWLAVVHVHIFQSLRLTLYHKIATFNDPVKMLKTLWEKEKMLVTSIFFFSHNVFYQSQKEFLFLSYIYFVVCKCFQFGPVQNFVVW